MTIEESFYPQSAMKAMRERAEKAEAQLKEAQARIKANEAQITLCQDSARRGWDRVSELLDIIKAKDEALTEAISLSASTRYTTNKWKEALALRPKGDKA